jgi:hypothetical protein
MDGSLMGGHDGVEEMQHPLAMRLPAFAFCIFALAATPALAAPDWNGTWVGNWQSADGNGIQVMMAGNDATGIFWNGDYLPDELHSVASADGKTLTITWNHSSATLVRDGESAAHIVIHEPGHRDSAFTVMLDK